MNNADQLLVNNGHYAESFPSIHLATPPSRKLAIIACMDSRIDMFGSLGLELGEAHIIRNAGGVITDDVIRSLMISQRLLGTREVILIHHTECGMLTFTDDELKAQIEREVGIRPPFALEAFTDLDSEVLQSIARVKNSPFVPYREHVRGFVFDVRTGRLREVMP